MAKTTFTSIDAYIQTFPSTVAKILNDIRQTIHNAAPEATEVISYQLPTFKLQGKNLVHFGAFKEHIGFYPTPGATGEFKNEIAKYAFAKGSIRFPLSEPMPHDLITKIVKFRVKEVSKK